MTLLPVEREALEGHVTGAPLPPLTEADAASWILFCLRGLLTAGRTIRKQRLASWEGSELDLKGDGSPVTAVDRQVEDRLRQALYAFAPGAVLVGEESGGDLPESGMALAVDPIDGTWAFITSSSTHASSLALFRDGSPWLGFVGNPVTGEIAYTHPEAGARLIQLDLLGEGAAAFPLPLRRGVAGKILVSLHPSRSAAEASARLHRSWVGGDLCMVRAPGGSPADGLMESAKGHYTYVNLWNKAPAAPYDLAAGTLVLQAAGGEVEDLSGSPIQVVGHEGAFVAGLEPRARRAVREILSATLPRESE